MRRINRRAFIHAMAYSATGALGIEGGWRLSRALATDPAFTYSETATPLNGPVHEALREQPVLQRADLARLPWFERAEDGQLCLKSGAGIPPITDFHTHVGWSHGLGRPVDMSQRSRVSYFFDYDAPQDFLQNQLHPTPAETESMAKETRSIFFATPERNQTHTAANLLDEMSRFNHSRAVLLPVEIPGSSRHSAATREAARLDERLIPFTGIYPKPWSSNKEDVLAERFKGGVRGLKLHPEFQFFAPDSPAGMKLLDWCAENNVLVLAHTGFTGKEPAFMRALAEPERFVAPLKAFPKLRIIFGHTGSRKRLSEALAVARQFESQVWLEFSGQPVPAIQVILDQFDTDKIVYGSDWPYYPLSVALARFLVATEGREDLREKILDRNALQLLANNGPASTTTLSGGQRT